jgi:hypothetical protein
MKPSRIVLEPIRYRPWYRWNWWFPLAILFGLAVWAFIIWCAAKAVHYA